VLARLKPSTLERGLHGVRGCGDDVSTVDRLLWRVDRLDIDLQLPGHLCCVGLTVLLRGAVDLHVPDVSDRAERL
jgi:hypothetical protein